MNIQENNSKITLSQKVIDKLEHMHYGVYNHSAVQICTWNKKALTNKGICYKEKFYNIDCHGCMEMAPTVMWCQQNCTFCWRPMEFMKNLEIKESEVDSPKDIIDNLIIKRQKLISGFGGHNDLNEEKFKDAQNPSHFSISLSGEPTMYPKLHEMIRYLKSLPKTKSIFIVSNGQEPEYFKHLITNSCDAPTQLYISIDAHNKEIFDKVNKSLYKDGWERLNQSLEHLSQIDTRTVLRMTQIKGLNDLDEYLEGYSEIFEKSCPDIIEVKSYMHIGLSQNRHTKKQMAYMPEVREFAKLLAETNGNYEIVAEMEQSKIVLLMRKNSKYKLDIEKFEN